MRIARTTLVLLLANLVAFGLVWRATSAHRQTAATQELLFPAALAKIELGLVTAEPGDRLSADILLRRADAAMYAVKRRGKGALIGIGYIKKIKTTADLDKTLKPQLAEWLSPVAGYCA